MSKKRTIRLTETEMINLIERIVTEVKKEKRNSIREGANRKKPARRPVSRRR